MVRRTSETPKFTPRQRGPVSSARVIPTYVTFKAAAQLLIDEGIVDSITPDGLRFIARTRPDWPFGEEGEGKPHTYLRVSNARLMAAGPLLDYCTANPLGRQSTAEPDTESAQ